VRRFVLPIAAVLLVAGLPLTGCANVTTAPQPAPTMAVMRSAPIPAPPSSPPPAPVMASPAIPRPVLTNASAVVQQYYQDITDHDYAAAWALGGSNISGLTYDRFVSGYATTQGVTLGTMSGFGASEVRAVLYATQTDGTVKVYEGTYTVAGGVLISASIRQVG